MKRRLLGVLSNWAIVVVLLAAFGGVLAMGIFHGQVGEVLFNATLV